MYKFLLLILFFTLVGCSTIEFKEAGTLKFSVGVKPSMARVAVANGVCDSYFWGTFDSDCAVNLYDQYKDQALYEPSFVKVTQNYSLSNILLTVATLGVYTPISYEVSVYSK
jgi:hypothetical protein